MSGRERDTRLVPVFRRQRLHLACPHVRRVGHDDIVGLLRLVRQTAEVVRFNEPHATPESMLPDVDFRDFQGVFRDIDPIYLRARERLGAGDRNTTRPCTHIEHALDSLRVYPWSELAFDQLGNGGSRNEHARIDVERKPREPGFIREVNDGDALFDSARDQLFGALTHGGRNALAVRRNAEVVGQIRGVKYECGRFVDRVLDSMTVEHLGPLQAAGAPADEIADSAVGYF